MTEPIKLLELFSGIQAQERSLRQIGIPYESVGVCDCDKDVLVSAAAMRFNLEEEIVNYNFPSTEIMITELQNKNIGYSFEKNKHTITTRTPINKLKQYYISDKLLNNLGDISKVNKLPIADLVTYSSPCQSFSVAGKLGGATKTCKECGHKWEIDFSNPDYNYKCPICGNTSLESTTSGLLSEVQRLLSVSYENNTLPRFLLLENVKNLVGKKFIHQFNDWIQWLSDIGYNTYYEVLNSKNYGLPQNRERVFALSIRKDVDNGEFKFPNQIPLNIRLKNILEKNVDKKYYIDNDRVNSILYSDTFKEKLLKKIQTDTDVPIRLTNIYDERFGTGYAGNVWDTNGISPTLQTAQGGNRQPLIVEVEPFVQKDNLLCVPIVCEERRDEGIRLFADESCGTLRTIDSCGDKRVIEFEVDTIKVKNQATEFADFTDVAGTLLARDYKGFGNQEMTAVMETYANTMSIKMKIRKLTTKESFRLMGFSDDDHDRASRYVSASALYKQAGNSICTCCLVAIFNALFLQDYSTSYAEKLVDYHNS